MKMRGSRPGEGRAFLFLLSLMLKRLSLSILLACGAALPTHGLNYTESTDGDLTATIVSNIATAPTPIVFDLGVNTIAGTMGGDPGDGIPLDRDFFTFTLAPGQTLTSINFLGYTNGGQSFYAIAPGTSIAIDSAANHLSNMLVTQTGQVLPTLALGAYNGGTGLSNPVGPGTYTIWFQEVSSVVTYSTAYTVVPEPGSVTVLISGLALLLQLRRRAKSPA